MRYEASGWGLEFGGRWCCSWTGCKYKTVGCRIGNFRVDLGCRVLMGNILHELDAPSCRNYGLFLRENAGFFSYYSS